MSASKTASKKIVRTYSEPNDPSIAPSVYPTEYATKEIQESDRNYFESFQALKWKQENLKERIKTEISQEAKLPPPDERKFVSARPCHKLSTEEFEGLYVETLYTIKYKVGKSQGAFAKHVTDLYKYASQAFGVSADKHQELLAKASEEKPPVLVLDVTVIEGRDLEAKDADGFSDPYCMLGVVPSSQLGRERLESDKYSDNHSSEDEASGTSKSKRGDSRLKRFSQSLRKKRGLDRSTAKDDIPAKCIKCTSVKNNTLNPVWKERFRLDLEDLHTDALHLDIWDHDDEFSVIDAAKQLNQVQGIKGLGRYFKQIAQSARTNKKGNVDDFLGSINISLRDIPSTGLDEWFDLEGRSSRSNIEGQIHLMLHLATREDRGIVGDDNWVDLKEHEDLIAVFIEYELSKFTGDSYQWTGQLSQSANTILHQHAIQGDITEVQEAVCRWRAYARKHEQHPCDWGLILRLLTDLEEKWEPGSLSRDEEIVLGESLNNFINYCSELLYRVRQAFPPGNKAAQVRLQFLAQCLAKLYEMELFKRCCPFANSLSAQVSAVVKKSNSKWFEQCRKNFVEKHTTPPAQLNGLIDMINLFILTLDKDAKFLKGIFDSYLGCDYMHVVFKTLDNLIGQQLEEDLKHVPFILRDESDADGSGQSDNFTMQTLGTKVFELYASYQAFVALQECMKDSRVPHTTKFYEAFKVPLQQWISSTKYKMMRRIKKAVELDQVKQVAGQLKQSTSAIDVSACFGQIISFWMFLSWPDVGASKVFVVQLSDNMCQGAIYYADLIHEKLRAVNYFDDVGRFDVTQELCRVINDLEIVRRALKPLPTEFHYDDIIKEIKTTENEGAAAKVKAELYGRHKVTIDSMVSKIKCVVDRVADKMSPDIKKFVFHLCWAPEKASAEDAISELMHYLDSNLLTLNVNLLRANFVRILDSIWIKVLEEIQEVVDKEEMRESWFFDRLSQGLDIMVEFFCADEKGLSMKAVQNDHYEVLRHQLHLNNLTTEELLEVFYVEKMAEQDKVECTYGTLSVRAYYNKEAELLSVEVLNARNVIPLDTNGLSDPFVTLELCPSHVFGQNVPLQQTKVIKKSLNPTFNEAFEFFASTAQCHYHGACVHFTVMDHDLLLSNDFAGETFLSLNGIPGLNGDDVPGFYSIKPVCLVLTQPKRGIKTKANSVLSALRKHEDDRVAQDFVKKRRQIEAQAQP